MSILTRFMFLELEDIQYFKEHSIEVYAFKVLHIFFKFNLQNLYCFVNTIIVIIGLFQANRQQTLSLHT